jgi:phosphoribosylglycinamide formyltransferase-1
MFKHSIAIFASGTGSNALNIIEYFKNNSKIKVAFVLCNKFEAPIVKSAFEKGIKVIVCTNQEVENSEFLYDICKKNKVTEIILAGFLRKIPALFIQKFQNKIINIHPSLLPKYGGNGMYGKFVHEAVIKNDEKETGISIHLVDDEYDKGEIIAQYKVELSEKETIDSIQLKIHILEMKNFPKTIEEFLNRNNS